jgi:hypothetical protein
LSLFPSFWTLTALWRTMGNNGLHLLLSSSLRQFVIYWQQRYCPLPCKINTWPASPKFEPLMILTSCLPTHGADHTQHLCNQSHTMHIYTDAHMYTYAHTPICTRFMSA